MGSDSQCNSQYDPFVAMGVVATVLIGGLLLLRSQFEKMRKDNVQFWLFADLASIMI